MPGNNAFTPFRKALLFGQRLFNPDDTEPNPLVRAPDVTFFDPLKVDDLGLLYTRPMVLTSGGVIPQAAAENTETTILTSSARTANTISGDFTNLNSKGGHFVINVTAVTGAASITVTIQGKDESTSDVFYDLLVSSAISTTGTTVLKIYPGIGQLANAAASDILPRTFRVSVAHSTGDSITYSVGANLDI